MERASVQFEVDDDSESDSSSLDIKEEPFSEESESDIDNDDGDSLAEDIEVKREVSDGGNTGMAAVMAKILKKSVEGSVIMSKSVSEKVLAARKRRHIDNAEPGGDLEVVKTEPDVKPDPSRKKVRKMKSHTASLQLKLEKEELGHTFPDPLNKNAELNLMKIATRGVVQLFNAVRQQQGKIKEKVSEVKSSISKTDKVISKFTSGDFLDRLKSQNIKTVGNRKEGTTEDDVKQEVKEEPTWSALRDDFMMGSQSMKDWDKDDSVQESNDSSLSDSDSE